MDPKKLGKKIRVARIELVLSQTQLAEKINAKQKTSLAMKQTHHYHLCES